MLDAVKNASIFIIPSQPKFTFEDPEIFLYRRNAPMKPTVAAPTLRRPLNVSELKFFLKACILRLFNGKLVALMGNIKFQRNDSDGDVPGEVGEVISSKLTIYR